MLTKKNVFLWLVLSLFTCNISVLFLGRKLKIYNDDAWYNNWYYWVLGLIFGIMPALIMLFILVIEVNVQICKKLGVPGMEIYAYPYVWIGSIIVPFVGWTLFVILLLYIYVMHFIYLFKGSKIYSN